MKKEAGRGGKRQHGQALATVVLLLAGTLVGLAFLAQIGRDLEGRVRAQMVADSAAEAGAVVLADALNNIALGNLFLTGLGLMGIITANGELLRQIQTVQGIQDGLAATAPTASVARALAQANAQGAQTAIPLNYLSGAPLPDLMVERVYFAGIPLWMRDTLTGAESPYGKRFIRLQVTMPPPASVPAMLLGNLAPAHSRRSPIAVAEAAASGKRVLAPGVFFPLPEPGYRARLVAIKKGILGLPFLH